MFDPRAVVWRVLVYSFNTNVKFFLDKLDSFFEPFETAFLCPKDL